VNENDGATAVGTLTVGPVVGVDGDDTVSAKLTVGHGTLSVANSSLPVTVTPDSSGGLTISGSAADVNTVLASLKYTPTPEYEGSDTLNVTVTSMDGSSTSSTQGIASTAITVDPVAETPTLTASDVSVNENQTATVLNSLASLSVAL